MKNIRPSSSLIIDTGFWVALGNPKDKYHNVARQAIDKFDRFISVVTWPIIVETSHLLDQRVGFQAQQMFLKNIQQGGAEIFHLDKTEHLEEMTRLMQKYQGLPMDLADASLVILAQELDHGRILSTDQRDFRAYRWKNHKPFENFLLPE